MPIEPPTSASWATSLASTTRTFGRRRIPIPEVASSSSGESARRDRKRLKASDTQNARLVAQGGGVDRERHVLLLCLERLEREACFHSSECGAQAEMLSESEAEMSLVIRAI